jgi:hypothetical protein
MKNAADPIIAINLPDHVKYIKLKETDPKTKEKYTKQLPLFVGDDSVKGEVEIRLNNTRKLDHMGIKIELIGMIGKVAFNRGGERQGAG